MIAFPFWPKKKTVSEESVVIDVAQDEVTAFWLSPNGDAKAVHDVEVTKIPRYPWTTKNRLRQLSSEAATATLQKLIGRQKTKPQKIETIIAPGLESGLGYLIKYNERQQFNVSNHLVKHLVKAHEDRIMRELGDGGEPHIIKTDILETRLNGYKLNDVALGEGNDLAITSYTGVLPKRYLQDLSQNLQSTAFQAPVVWSSRLALDVTTLKNELGGYDEAIIVDLTGYTTDLLIYNQSGDIVTASFDLGLDTILQNLNGGRDSNTADTQTLLKLYLDNSLHSRVNEQLKQSLARELATFSAYFYSALSQTMRFVKLPKQVILIGPENLSQHFAIYLTSENFHQKLLLPFPFEFTVLSTTDHLTKLLMGIYKAW